MEANSNNAIIEKNIAEIDKDLALLAAEPITLATAQRLSVLYCAKSALCAFVDSNNINIPQQDKNATNGNSDGIRNELMDILPALGNYLECKRRFYSGETTQLQVNHYLEKLVVEINEFIVVLQANCCCNDELAILNKLICSDKQK